MLHVVKIRFAGEDFHECEGWLNCENAQPSTFRYWLSEPDSVMRVDFEFEAQQLNQNNPAEGLRKGLRLFYPFLAPTRFRPNPE